MNTFILLISFHIDSATCPFLRTSMLAILYSTALIMCGEFIFEMETRLNPQKKVYLISPDWYRVKPMTDLTSPGLQFSGENNGFL